MVKEPTRPNPNDILAHIQASEQQKTRGKLKIFLGYAAGVGKTYAMLEAAHQRQAEGVDVIVGYVETHGRAETEAMLAGLEQIPVRSVEYHQVQLKEMDLDAILARRPQLVLVDELAHANAPGSIHPKRYQDIQHLLSSGIDVYTTLNIQHLESVSDVVNQVTGVEVHERVPDSVIDASTEIELIDLPPDELLQRLRDGKVYIPTQAQLALQKFFRTGNLTALRELTMRRAAQRVDDQVLAYMQTRSIPGPWPVNERLLVCISYSPFSERLVRAARRLADELGAEWQAVYIETPGYNRLTPEEKDQLSRTLQLVEELGGKSLTLLGDSVAAEVLDYARRHNFTKLIVGRPLRSRWTELLRRSIVDEILHQSGDIDLYVVSDTPEQKPAQAFARRRIFRAWQRYLKGLLLVLGATALSAFFKPLISPTNLVMIYLLSVVIAAVRYGRGPSILVSILGVLAFDLFFVPPYYTFVVANAEYLLTFAGLLVVGLVISQLTAKASERAETARQRANETAALLNFSRDLSIASDWRDITQAVIRNVEQTFEREVVVYLPDSEAEDELIPYTQHSQRVLDEKETAVAMWVFQHGQSAGRDTDTLPASSAHYLPMRTSQGVVGVLGIFPAAANSHIATEEPQRTAPEPLIFPHPSVPQQHLLEAFAGQAALALERVRLADETRKAQLLQETEKLQTALLNSISHDLRTPLVTITGALSSLDEMDAELTFAARKSLIVNAREEADRLNRLVGNLLEMTRIDAGAIHLLREPCELQDLVGSALEPFAERVKDRLVQIDMPPDLPLIPLDYVLMVHVLSNIIDNALKYSPSGSPIEISAELEDDQVALEVADHGIGIPEEDLTRIFDKFYRVRRPESVNGTGLGLAICKGIVDVHGGHISARNRPGGGAILRIAFPYEALKTVQAMESQ
jgi:two-component system, OmpR family, sensor histidine kinase KdpD